LHDVKGSAAAKLTAAVSNGADILSVEIGDGLGTADSAPFYEDDRILFNRPGRGQLI
jgi:hypothetical protein